MGLRKNDKNEFEKNRDIEENLKKKFQNVWYKFVDESSSESEKKGGDGDDSDKDSHGSDGESIERDVDISGGMNPCN